VVTAVVFTMNVALAGSRSDSHAGRHASRPVVAGSSTCAPPVSAGPLRVTVRSKVTRQSRSWVERYRGKCGGTRRRYSERGRLGHATIGPRNGNGR